MFIVDPLFSIGNLVDLTNQSNIFSAKRRHFLRWSRAIEDQVLNNGLVANLYAGFQGFSHFVPQFERYKQLAEVTGSVWLFGVKDTVAPVIDRTQVVTLTTQHQLAGEWFVMINHPMYAGLFVACEVNVMKNQTWARRMCGILTNDRATIDRVEDGLRKAIALNEDTPRANLFSSSGNQMHALN
jgi:DICT domain-containing protein